VILIGELSLWVALLLSAWSGTVAYAGAALGRDDLAESGVRGLYATFAMIALASAGLWRALLSRDFSLEYVAGHLSQNTPSVYAFTALWTGRAGGLLFGALMLSFCGTIAIASARRRNRALAVWAAGTVSAVLLFIIATSCFAANPFARLDVTPLDGRGMDPVFQSSAMALHQPSLLLGYVATALPFAFTVGVLFTRRLDGEWLGEVRRWTLIAWLFLTVAIALGMRWAYLEPDRARGGRWALYAVEDWSLFPWFAVTASLHAIVVRTKRQVRGKWIAILAGASFLLAVIATTHGRGGIDESLPSTSRSPVGTWFSAFFFLAAGVTVYLTGTRLRDLAVTAEVESRASKRRRFGGHIVHAGAVVFLAALAGLQFSREYDAKLKTGEAFEATDPYGRLWRFVSQGVSQFDRPDHIVAILALDAYRDGKRVGLITSEKRTYRDVQGNAFFEPSIEVGIHSTATLDAYIIPADIRRVEGSDVAKLEISFNPLVRWVWVGGLLMALGGVIVMWPDTV